MVHTMTMTRLCVVYQSNRPPRVSAVMLQKKANARPAGSFRRCQNTHNPMAR